MTLCPIRHLLILGILLLVTLSQAFGLPAVSNGLLRTSPSRVAEAPFYPSAHYPVAISLPDATPRGPKAMLHHNSII